MEMRSQVHKRRRKGAKWLYILLAVLIVLGIVWSFFAQAMNPITKAQTKYEALVLSDNKLKKVGDFYHIAKDGKTYYSVSGKNSKGQATAVIYTTSNEKLNKNGTVVNLEGKLNAQSVKKEVERSYQPKQITSLGMAIYQGVPVWDVTFIDKSGNMTFVTYQISNGQLVRTIQNL
ncbi:hypothetical protein ESZ50_01140 [Weissella muntiaci]|uniref:Cell wall elongation regulator TseB-like domain-containing protein n=1 Tax=Weissella muntiaci TaxID=2508881 RepID=A0A6C2CBK5_9LACO|nr:DUF5590 domain-containing protein [Weissella muntiaci]TYC50849.1 hypothetical protein ESZ50_01140 [Weissella muntiaci]